MNEDSRSLQEIPKLNYVVKDLNDKVDAVYLSWSFAGGYLQKFMIMERLYYDRGRSTYVGIYL